MTKNIFKLLALLTIPTLFISCSDKNDIPDVDITITINNVVDYQGKLYIIQGDTLDINSIDIKGNEGKNAIITEATYAWDYHPLGTNIVPPYGLRILTNNAATGAHLITISFTIVQKNKPVSYAGLNYDVIIVPDAASLPEGTQPGHAIINYTISPEE